MLNPFCLRRRRFAPTHPTDLAVGTGEVALFVEGEVEGAEAVALAPGANHSGHELSATAGHALDLGEELGVARSLVIDELGRQGPQVLLLLFEQPYSWEWRSPYRRNP